MDDILHTLRHSIVQGLGPNGIRALQQYFTIASGDNHFMINADDFINSLMQWEIPFDIEDIQSIVSHFCGKETRTVDVTQFFAALRESGLSDRRRMMAKTAFNKFSKTASDTVDIAELRSTYDAKRHPKVLGGQLKLQDAMNEFSETFNPNTNADGTVSWAEFEAYYSGVSTDIDNDEYFEMLLSNTWKVDDMDTTNSNNGLSDLRKNMPPGSISVPHNRKREPCKRIVGYAGHIPGAMNTFGMTYDQSERNATVSIKKSPIPAPPQGFDIHHSDIPRVKAIYGNAHSYKLE
jgi:Ca2+-binding EF-hand superfamily protein